MRDQAAQLRERLSPKRPVAEVWAVATCGGERGALAFAREIQSLLQTSRLKVSLWGQVLEEAQVVLLPAGDGVAGVRRPYMRGAHTWLLLAPGSPEGLTESQQLLAEMSDGSLRSVYLALSGVPSVAAGEAMVRTFAEQVLAQIPCHPEPFGFYGPSETGALTLSPVLLRRFFAGGR
ncbi:MAG: hypothetical protein M0Z66_06165 [Thermaerobacter sp.]|nr:hypothetical protein [Thermaerobacter sp.]